MAKEDKEEIIQDDPPVKKRPIMKIIVIVLSTLVVLGAGTVGALYFYSRSGAAKKAETPAPPLTICVCLQFIIIHKITLNLTS